MFGRLASKTGILVAGVGAFLVILLVHSSSPININVHSDFRNHFSAFSSSSSHAIVADTPEATLYRQGIALTNFLAHQPGFSVVENIYWRNYTYYVLTDQPWSVPQLDHIIGDARTMGAPHSSAHPIVMLSIRERAISGHVNEDLQLGTTISVSEALELSQSSLDLESPMIINDDENFIAHYYHWIGEMFLGGWRIWSYYAFRSGVVLPEIKAIGYTRMYDLADTVDHPTEQFWEDHAGANDYFNRAFFPGVTIESRLVWEQRADTDYFYRIPLAIVTNRAAGHRGPSAAWKPWGDVLRMPVAVDYLVNLRNRVLKGYKGSVPLKHGALPKVMYLSRQDTTRRLEDEDHEALVRALQQLESEGLVELNLAQFTDADGFDDQVATMSTVDFFIGVHGNGLTHTLWMTPGMDRAVFEIQPRQCTITDYGPLALAAGVDYYLIREDSYCQLYDCPDRGCQDTEHFPEGVNTRHMHVNPTVITNVIRKLIGERL